MSVDRKIEDRARERAEHIKGLCSLYQGSREKIMKTYFSKDFQEVLKYENLARDDPPSNQ
ncbi:hypothetical protein GOV13_02485 [Candidatus Pacearchaeota archaeon]|nr:hypothetical protein [Candidatus Pacearchaeota archaeon]